MKVTAKLNYLHIAPRKVRTVVDFVKKMTLEEALAQLRFTPNRASGPITKLIKSAMANAENNFSLDADTLKISEFRVDGGPVFKRFRPASRGQASPLRRKTSHVTLVLEGQRLKPAEKSETRFRPREERKFETAASVKPKGSSQGDVFRSKPIRKGSGFVRRMFQRKSI